jgi:hypothetical protein
MASPFLRCSIAHRNDIYRQGTRGAVAEVMVRPRAAREELMDNVSVRALAKYSRVIVKRIEESDEPMLVTREERPAAYLVPLSAAEKLGFDDHTGKKLTRGELTQWE